MVVLCGKAILSLLRLLTYLRILRGLSVTGPILLVIGRLHLGLSYGLSLVYAKKLFPDLVALNTWGEFFRDRRIMLYSDNKGVVFCINCLSAKSQPVITVYT